MYLTSIGAAQAAAEAAVVSVQRSDWTTLLMTLTLAVMVVMLIVTVTVAVVSHQRAQNVLKVSRDDSEQSALIAEIGTDVEALKRSMSKTSESMERLSERQTAADVAIGYLEGKIHKGGSKT